MWTQTKIMSCDRSNGWREGGMSSPSEYGANTPMYIYRMWGGEVPLKEIEKALGEVKR